MQEFLISSLEKLMRRKVYATKLLCTQHICERENLHRYIDNKPNLVMIARTVNNHVTAAFTESPFIKGEMGKERGMLLSLSRRKVSCKKN